MVRLVVPLPLLRTTARDPWWPFRALTLELLEEMVVVVVGEVM